MTKPRSRPRSSCARWMTRSTTLTLLALFAVCPSVAEVVGVEITHRETIELTRGESRAGNYERIEGILRFEVDPGAPANERVRGLELAPRNQRGRVEFAAEFELHRPLDPARGNRRLLYLVNNRGHKLGDGFFGNSRAGHWLYENGWSYLWCGWNADVPEHEARLNIELPVLTRGGETLTGRVFAEVVNWGNDNVPSLPLTWGGSVPHAAASLDRRTATLSKRRYPWEEASPIPNDRWEFARVVDGELIPNPRHLHVHAGIEPGWIYELVYEARDPKPTGLGLAAIRDAASFFRYAETAPDGATNPLAGAVEFAYAWGHSQSARVLNHFVYEGFNADETGRFVFDGMIPNCGGAGRGQFNSLFAQTTRHGSHLEDNLYPIDVFPFTSTNQRDPVTGRSGDALAGARASGAVPRILAINSSTDYWTRGASLIHTDVLGKKDAALDASVRIYHVAGIAHTEGRLGVLGRALLVALDKWVTDGIAPPASNTPRLDDGTLVDLEAIRESFPAIPRVTLPDSFYKPYRLDPGPRWESEGIADHVPPKTGPRFEARLPQVDTDGNELGGVRLPELAAPLATYTGWGLRNPAFSKTLGRNAGRIWPFALDAEEREASGDPRPSIRERYPSKATFVFARAKAIMQLHHEGLLLEEDVAPLLEEALRENHWLDEPSPLRLVSARAEPQKVVPGGTVLLVAELRGETAPVAVEVTFREARNWTRALRDDGREGDAAAGDGRWTYRLTLPGNVPPGSFHFDVRALDRDYRPVPLADGATGTVVIEVVPAN